MLVRAEDHVSGAAPLLSEQDWEESLSLSLSGACAGYSARLVVEDVLSYPTIVSRK